MCLAIPMRVVWVDGLTARCEAKGIMRDVSLLMMQNQPVAPGEMLLIHLGYARRKVSEEDARSTWELLDQIVEIDEASRA